MQVLAGSHTWPEVFVAGRNVFKPPNPPLDEQFAQISRLAGGRTITPQPLVVKAGGVTVHSSRVVHGSFPNVALEQGRLSLVIHMIVDGTAFRGWDEEGAGHSSNILLRPESAGEPCK
jgi:ectoine hydroxylase-related dioxygenase (phytanoyl-CoA dioxygenase family)